MSRNHKHVPEGQKIEEIPPWARDNLVLKLLDDYGLTLEVTYDKKYLNGLANKPLIIIKGKLQKPDSPFKWI